jgi:phosphoglycolate phosphatase-like HAD superfamily hydrolase
MLRRFFLCLWILLIPSVSWAKPADPLPSWNDGPVKRAIVQWVKTTTKKSSPKYIPPDARIAVFDQDGTLWVEQPMYAQFVYSFDRVRELAKIKPDIKNKEPFETVLSGSPHAIGKLKGEDFKEIFVATLTGMRVDEFTASVSRWLQTALHPRFHRHYTSLAYQPMLELMSYLRASGFKTYIVTGGGQDFVRVYSEKVYGIPPEQIVGTVGATKFGYDENGKAILTKTPQVLLIDDKAGKAEGIYMMIGRRPVAAFGNSTGDQEMLEYTQAGGGIPIMALVHHDDAVREYAYGPDSKIGTFSEALMEEAKAKGWLVISMKNDWKRIFSWEK